MEIRCLKTFSDWVSATFNQKDDAPEGVVAFRLFSFAGSYPCNQLARPIFVSHVYSALWLRDK